MDLKTKVSIEAVRKDGDKERLYQFSMPYGVALGEAYDVCHEVLQKLVEMAQQASDRAAQKKEEDPKDKK